MVNTIDIDKHTLTIDRDTLAYLRSFAFVLEQMTSKIKTLLADAAHADGEQCDICSLDGDLCADVLEELSTPF